jgi:hypothetical protein
MSKGRTHMSLLSNQQGRPASVRARPPSRSPKGLSLAGQTILVTGLQFRQRAGDVSRARAARRSGAWDGAHKGEGCGCVRDASRQGGRLLLRAFRSFVCARVQRRANTFRHAPTSISRMQRDWLRYGPSASRYARGFEMKLAGKPSSPGLARTQHRFEASVSVFQSSSS